MPTLVTLKKNGKSFRVSNNKLISNEGVKCPFCKDTQLEEDNKFDLHGCSVQTELAEDFLPKSLKDSMSLIEGLDIYICKKCGSMFLVWEIGDWDYDGFYEIKDVETEDGVHKPRPNEHSFSPEY